MKFTQAGSHVHSPDGLDAVAALGRVTHLGIGAHQDDLEFMAFQGVLECYHHPGKWFGGITCTNGSGSSRIGPYQNHTDEQMMAVRRQEQDMAATVGRYGIMIQLNHPSRHAKSSSLPALRLDLEAILAQCCPEVIYTHNLADKHDTHVGVALRTIEALRNLAPARRPRRVIGCEVWRGLDWLCDADKVLMDVSAHGNLAAAVNGVFDSQIAGGKRYDLAALGRRAANATFLESHATDKATHLIFGMDLTPLVQDTSLDPAEFVVRHIRRFEKDVQERLTALKS